MCSLVEINVFHINHIADVFFFTIPLSVLIFVVFVKYKISNKNILATLGEKYSLYVYILHPVIIKVLTNSVGKNTYYAGIIAFLLTLVTSILFVKIKDFFFQHLNISK